MSASRKPGYYWAKLLRPDYGDLIGEDWVSLEWEIVELNDNNGQGDEAFSVQVFGVPVTQWPHCFDWGPPVLLEGKPS